MKRKQINTLKGYCCFLFLFVLIGFSNAQTDKIDSLKRVLSKESDSLMVFDLTADIAWEYSKKNIDKAIEYGERALRLAIKFHNKNTIGYAYNALGTFYLYKPNYDKAMKSFQESLKIQEELNNPLNISKVYNNIGNIYLKINLHEKALEQYKLALEYKRKAGAGNSVFPNLMNLGSLYFKMKTYPDALRYYEEAIKVVDTIKDKKMLPLLYSNLGLIERHNGNYKKAMEYYLLAEKTGKAIDEVSSDLYSNIAHLYQLNGDYLLANENLYKAYAIAATKSDLDKTIHLYFNLTQNYTYLNKGDSALKYLMKYKELRDSVYTSQSLKSLQEVSAKYETEKKEQLIKLLAKDKAIQELKIKDQSFQLATERLEKERQLQQIDLLNKDKQLKESEIQKERLSRDKSEKEIELLNSQKKLTEETIKRQKIFAGFIITGLLLSLGLAFFILKNYKQQKTANKIISEQKLLVEKQKHLVLMKQKEILDSIHYAGRIQQTLMANTALINSHIPENFILCKPKDIVSGDFFWATKKTSENNEELLYLAVCDSTGHGVPGAFMSLLNISFLNEAVNEKNIRLPNEIFNYVRKRLTDSFSREGQKDGFDGVLLCLNLQTKEISYAAANIAPVQVSSNEIIKLPYNKMPVGYGLRSMSFDLYTLRLEKNDSLYLSTDGYADQFGGERGKKFMQKHLNSLFKDIYKRPYPEQKEVLSDRFNAWKGDLEQVDDVCIIGMKF